MSEKNKGGRPSTYTQGKADAICDYIMEGYSLRKIAAQEGMPDKVTILKWLDAHPTFATQYARAKQEQAEALADEIVDIADEEAVTIRSEEGEEVRVTFDAVAVNRNRLRVDARKWVAAKLLPKKYGDKYIAELTGPNGGPVVSITAEMTAKEAEDAYKSLLG